MLTASVTIALEGEQARLFQEIEAQEARIKAQLQPLQQKRNDMVSVLLAGKGLLQSVLETPGVAIDVSPDTGIVVTVPNIAPEE